MQREFSWWWWMISTLVATVSLISFLERGYALGVGPILQEVIAFYRHVVSIFIDIVTSKVGFRLSAAAKDIFVLVALPYSVLMRAALVEDNGGWLAKVGSSLLVFVISAFVTLGYEGINRRLELREALGFQPGSFFDRFLLEAGENLDFVARFLPVTVIIALVLAFPIMLPGTRWGDPEVGRVVWRYYTSLMAMSVAAGVVFALNWTS